MNILGYKYVTEHDAIKARQNASDYHGLPISAEASTLYYVDYIYSEKDTFWYIVWCEGCNEALGEPIEFEVTDEEI